MSLSLRAVRLNKLPVLSRFAVSSFSTSSIPNSTPLPPLPHSSIIRNTLTGRSYELALAGDFDSLQGLGPFGTIERPALIFSGLDSRIVGCVGGRDVKHRLLWFNLKIGKKHMCQECGQVFKLVNDSNILDSVAYMSKKLLAHLSRFGTLSNMDPAIPKVADYTNILEGINFDGYPELQKELGKLPEERDQEKVETLLKTYLQDVYNKSQDGIPKTH